MNTPHHDLSRFTLADMTSCGARLRRLGEGAATMEGVAEAIVRDLYESLVDDSGTPCCALVRFYKTHDFDALDPSLQEFSRKLLRDEAPAPRLKCLTLLATVGDQPEWNSRTSSRGHRAIPLASPEMVRQFPMIVQLVRQFGLDEAEVVQTPLDFLVDLEQRNYNVFYVPEALGSPHIPAQEDFVVPFGIRSVLGFGGILPSGDLFAVILFSRVRIERETADLFKSLALSVKVALLDFVEGPVFA